MQVDKRFIFILIILVSFFSGLEAADTRTIPLDMYLIIDSSESFQGVKNDAITWLNRQVVDRILMEGDKVTIWTAGDRAQIIYSAEITSSTNAKNDIKDKLLALQPAGRKADFSGALEELLPKQSQTPGNRLSYTMLVTSSAGVLGSIVTGNYHAALKWSRSEKYERWQALIVAPDISQKVSQAAAAYMNSIRQ